MFSFISLRMFVIVRADDKDHHGVSANKFPFHDMIVT